MRYREIKEVVSRAELEAHNEKIATIKRNIKADEEGALSSKSTISAWAKKNPYALDADTSGVRTGLNYNSRPAASGSSVPDQSKGGRCDCKTAQV